MLDACSKFWFLKPFTKIYSSLFYFSLNHPRENDSFIQGPLYNYAAYVICFIIQNLPVAAFPPDPPTITNKFLQLIDPSLTLRWTKPEENGRPIFKYVICHRVLNSSQWNETDVGNILNYNFTLNWGVSYEFALMAVNNQGRSNKSKLETFTVVPGKLCFLT